MIRSGFRSARISRGRFLAHGGALFIPASAQLGQRLTNQRRGEPSHRDAAGFGRVVERADEIAIEARTVVFGGCQTWTSFPLRWLRAVPVGTSGEECAAPADWLRANAPLNNYGLIPRDSRLVAEKRVMTRRPTARNAKTSPAPCATPSKHVPTISEPSFCFSSMRSKARRKLPPRSAAAQKRSRPGSTAPGNSFVRSCRAG